MMEHLQLPNSVRSDHADLARALEESIQAFCSISDVPVAFFDQNGTAVWECQGHGKICSFFEFHKEPNSVCGRNLAASAKLASQLSEPYVFVCKAGLVKIAVSLIVDEKLVGCFMAGPVIMGGLKESVITNIFSLSSVPMEAYPKIILFLRSMKVFKAKEVSYLAALLYNSILAPITPNENYSKINSQYQEQRRIGESLQKHKKEQRKMPYPFALENQMIERIQEGDKEAGLDLLHRLLTELSVLEAGDLSAIKTKVLSICALLSRAVAERFHFSQEETEIHFNYMNDLNEAANLQELERLAVHLVDTIAESFSAGLYSGRSQIIIQAVRIVHDYYKDGISLAAAAEHLHTNPSYLSMLFRQETGVTFTDYLNQTRINRSCELLHTTGFSLAEIATLSGFEDQSYFSKVFKKLKGITPKDYRKQQTESQRRLESKRK